MIIFTLRRLLLLLVTLVFSDLYRLQPELFHPSCAATGRLPVECVAVLVSRGAALGFWRLQH